MQDHRTTVTAIMRRKGRPGPELFKGDIRITDEDTTEQAETTLAVVYLWPSDHPSPEVWIDRRLVASSAYRLIETWARRLAGAGKCAEVLSLDDLRATPGLFDAVA